MNACCEIVLPAWSEIDRKLCHRINNATDPQNLLPKPIYSLPYSLITPSAQKRGKRSPESAAAAGCEASRGRGLPPLRQRRSRTAISAPPPHTHAAARREGRGGHLVAAVPAARPAPAARSPQPSDRCDVAADGGIPAGRAGLCGAETVNCSNCLTQLIFNFWDVFGAPSEPIHYGGDQKS